MITESLAVTLVLLFVTKPGVWVHEQVTVCVHKGEVWESSRETLKYASSRMLHCHTWACTFLLLVQSTQHHYCHFLGWALGLVLWDVLSRHIEAHARGVSLKRLHSWSDFSDCCVVYLFSHFSCVQLCAMLHTLACQDPLSMRFFGQEYWSGLPFPSLGDLPDSGIEPLSFKSPVLAGRFFTTSTTWEAHDLLYTNAIDCLPWDAEKIVNFDNCTSDSPGALNRLLPLLETSNGKSVVAKL